ncbi:hypothetical protein [Planktothrix mougeotii]|uniref:Uncharacterized protein n=1 Tax=Planktothrix mougeotii LEGE 06226 TaxID=1828728 RepID=A0ABR9ULF0_9CYAN|nr:hypothetical protein [Planktothrix mougeotii]MBE9146369.1 hypothetical protein [Planktothrix mougeotii LEGE 06226]
MQKINHAYETFLNEWNQRVRSPSVKRTIEPNRVRELSELNRLYFE